MPDTKKGKSGLTAAWVKRAKPKDKPYKISDRDGLYLLIKTSGVRYWRMNCRFAGKQRTLSFGRWPELTLADARERSLNARPLLHDAIDPVEQTKLDQIAASVAQANTFEASLLRQSANHHQTTRNDQTQNYRTTTLASPKASSLISTNKMVPNTCLT